VGVFAPDKTAAWFMRYRFDEDTELELREEKNDVWPKVLQHYYAWSRGRPPAPETIFGVPGVYLTNLFNSKGLEFETVYLVRLQRLYRKLDDPMTLMLFYVAIARARSTIEFHYSGSEEPEIIGFLRNTGLDITFET
jgi:superfamily I DNA/RNA helicase